MTYSISEICDKYNSTLPEYPDNEDRAVRPRGDEKWALIQSVIKYPPNNFILPFWNWLVRQEDHDHEQHLLAMMAGEQYCEVTHLSSRWNSKKKKTVQKKTVGIIRFGYFCYNDGNGHPNEFYTQIVMNLWTRLLKFT